VLAGLVTAAGVGGQVASCAAPFDPQSEIKTLRVLSVDVDHPYANPGDTVTFKMTYFDGRDATGTFTPIQITWLGGCFNPPGDAYYGCYEQLGQLLQDVANGEIPPDGLVAQGPGLDTFSITLPSDIVSSVAPPDTGPRVGVGFVFFTVCAGEVRPVYQEGSTDAGSFPLGCFDANGNQLGNDAFIPGYTQVYAFEDARTNAAPPVDGFLFGGKALADGEAGQASACAITEEDRNKTGCAAPDVATECDVVALDVDVPKGVAEVDPDAFDSSGKALHEVVWVDYFADGGTFDTDLKLVSDASTGEVDDHSTEWTPPEEPGLYSLWAVVRDNRGGSTTLQRYVEVK
jgi:hypothetical protein